MGPRGAVTAPAMIAVELEVVAGNGRGGEVSAMEDSCSARSPPLDAQGCGTKQLQRHTAAVAKYFKKRGRHPIVSDEAARDREEPAVNWAAGRRELGAGAGDVRLCCIRSRRG